MSTQTAVRYVRWFEDATNEDVPQLGGKNASLGEMIQRLKDKGVRVPGGFATTADAYREFLTYNELNDKIRDQVGRLKDDMSNLDEVGHAIRGMFTKAQWPEHIANGIKDAYAELSKRYNQKNVSVAVRSSATAEDLPQASFAGQQETFLNVHGEEDLLDSCRKCYASLFTDRAIAYRKDQGFDQLQVALSVGIQKMVRSDKAGAGVGFSLDTDTGFRDVVVINAGWGLGETVVQGMINPDEYKVFKPLLDKENLEPIVEKILGAKEQKIIYTTGGSAHTKTVNTPKKQKRQFVLSNDEILQLARWIVTIEQHYGKPMDTEWAKDGETGEVYIVQARPETVQSRKQPNMLNTFTLKQKGERLVKGLSIGQGIATGKARVIHHPDEAKDFQDGDVIVTEMTDPDWVPLMKRASAIVTDHGGRTSHAAIVSRELGLSAVVGSDNATETLKTGQEVTVSCAEGEDGYVYDGKLDFEQREVDLSKLPKPPVDIMINIATPGAAFRWWSLPIKGVGLARMEFVISNVIQVHPMALVHFDELKDEQAKRTIKKLTMGYDDKTDYFVDHMSRGIATIAAAQYPNPVIVRMSDFKSNEYADLIGGEQFEIKEANPMLGFRGASRYYSDRYKEGFKLECKAVKKAREKIGLDNIIVMLPFVRTPEEADQAIAVMSEHGLTRGENGLKVYMMCEIPSNFLLAEEFAERFDGFSIGSNDLTQLVLGIDRDSEILRGLFNENHPAVKKAVKTAIEGAHKKGTKVGICGQAPSDYPDFAEFLVQAGIDTISLNPDSVIKVIERIAK